MLSAPWMTRIVDIMPFLQRQQIDLKIRGPYDRKYKTQLREALRTPGLTKTQKQAIQDKIRAVGKTHLH